MITNIWLLWLFLIGFLFYITISVFILYHLVRFGYLNAPTRSMVLLHLVVTLGVVIGVVTYGQTVQWNEPLDIDFPAPAFNNSQLQL